ncbi:hypothetical protein ACQUSR_00265 [Streptomyces sp. P1-3]|uniref:hypothetical protein n=1 Tax=Streptomyces sp. P1-3 TaxID=3421658 RepID=UPI003D363953
MTSFHDLRHTYALRLLDFLMRLAVAREAVNRGGASVADHIAFNPLLIVSRSLSHPNPATTYEYLRHLEELMHSSMPRSPSSTSSRVVCIPLDDPAGHATVTELSPHPWDAKLLDDLTSFDGDLVVASFRAGQLIRVDPATGRSCVLVTGLHMPCSVRVHRGFGDHDPRRELFMTEASGRIVKVTVG